MSHHTLHYSVKSQAIIDSAVSSVYTEFQALMRLKQCVSLKIEQTAKTHVLHFSMDERTTLHIWVLEKTDPLI